MEASKFAPYEARLDELWERMVRAVGIHTVNVLLERAIYQASQRFPELALIERTDQGLVYDELERAYADRPEREIDDAFTALTSELLVILARLLGEDMARRLAEELQARVAQEAERAGSAREAT